MRKLSKPRKYRTNCVEFYGGEITPVGQVGYYTHWSRPKSPGEYVQDAQEATKRADENNARGNGNPNSTREWRG